MTARVLVVDDIPANVKLLEAKLSAEYFGVVTATNGRDAIALCERGEVDIVLLDVMMPGMNGFEVCRRIKGTPATAHIPVVIVTALDQPRDRLQGLDAVLQMLTALAPSLDSPMDLPLPARRLEVVDLT